MSTGYLFLIAGTWVVIGLIAAFVMRRRGHEFFVWLVLGAILGPLVVPLSIERARSQTASESRSRRIPVPAKSGLDVLAGIDGSGESISAVLSAIELFGPEITSLTLATVLDYDAKSSVTGRERRRSALDMLREIASQVGFDPVATEILYGRADKALMEHARAKGSELIVVGSRGRGATEAIFGSITRHLVGGCEVPVLVGPCVPRGEPVGEDSMTLRAKMA